MTLDKVRQTSVLDCRRMDWLLWKGRWFHEACATVMVKSEVSALARGKRGGGGRGWVEEGKTKETGNLFHFAVEVSLFR